MAKIDFDTKNIGKQIHDDGEFDLPELTTDMPEVPEMPEIK